MAKNIKRKLSNEILLINKTNIKNFEEIKNSEKNLDEEIYDHIFMDRSKKIFKYNKFKMNLKYVGIRFELDPHKRKNVKILINSVKTLEYLFKLYKTKKVHQII